jgi:hypothetical protein
VAGEVGEKVGELGGGADVGIGGGLAVEELDV